MPPTNPKPETETPKIEVRNSGLVLYTGNRLEVLADELARLTATPLRSPLSAEVVMVQSRGMARWLAMTLARRLGIAANIDFPFPNHFVQTLFNALIPEAGTGNSPDTATLTWQIMAVLPPLIDQPAFEEIRRYLAEDPSQLKAYQLCEKIAFLLDQYLIYRPDMILGWDTGADDHWQAILWRALGSRFTRMHRAAQYRHLLERIGQCKSRPPGLPERLAVFGISSLPPFHLRILAALSRLLDINLFVLNPCREYWADIATGREINRETRRWSRRSGKAVDAKDLYLDKGNSLLASMGLLGRDFLSLIQDLAPGDLAAEEDRFVEPGHATLLNAIQSDLLNLHEADRDQSGPETPTQTISPSDLSIRFHACHTPMREIEILQDEILAMLDADPALSPRDILVMTPDIETYAPFIQAVFSLDAKDPRRIPFSIADRGARRESPYIEAFLALLDLHESRLGAMQVMALFDHAAIRKRLDLAEDGPETLRGWVRETGIRWGRDAEARNAAGLPEFADNSWAAGIERMLLGCALPPRSELFEGILPFEAASQKDADLLGRFVDFTDRLFDAVTALNIERSLGDWADHLLGIADAFLASDDETETDALFVRRTIDDLRKAQDASGFNTAMPFAPIQACLQGALEREGFGTGFLTGGVTFCAMLPMRSIPFKVICLIGMNDADYPRQESTLGFDLMARDPQPGDRSRRKDDRYLFLEAILSARDRLYLSYIGQSPQDNSRRPPSVLVSELLDYIEQGYNAPGGDIRDRLTTWHPLQAFHPGYFTATGRLFSYSPENCEAARRLTLARNSAIIPAGEPFFASPLAGEGAEPPDVQPLSVDTLCAFFKHPARFFLTRRLKVHLGTGEAALEESEPFTLEGLERYDVEQWLVGEGLRGTDLGRLWPVARASGILPPGTPGECLFEETATAVEAFVRQAAPWGTAVAPDALDIDLTLDGTRITGRVAPLFPEGLLYLRYASVRAADRLTAWIQHLLVALHIQQYGKRCVPTKTRILCKDFEGTYTPAADPAVYLKELLALYRRGQSEPLPLIPDISWLYAEALKKGKAPAEALSSARSKWYGNDFTPGKSPSEEPYNALYFKDADPLAAEASTFQALAVRIFEPILLHSGGSR